VSYKKEIIQDVLTRFPLAHTQSLAKMLHETSPLDFPTIENARSSLRYYRGEHGRNHKNPMAKRTEEQKKQANAWSKLPESDYKEQEPFQIPTANNRVLILSDIHLPYHDIDALSIDEKIRRKYGDDKGFIARFKSFIKKAKAIKDSF